MHHRLPTLYLVEPECCPPDHVFRAPSRTPERQMTGGHREPSTHAAGRAHTDDGASLFSRKSVDVQQNGAISVNHNLAESATLLNNSARLRWWPLSEKIFEIRIHLTKK